MWDLVPGPVIEPGPPALGAWCLGHWTTREVCFFIFFGLDSLRKPGTRDPLRQRVRLDKLSLSKKTQRNSTESECLQGPHSWGKLWTKRYKETKKSPTATSEEPEAEQGIHWLCTHHPQRAARPPLQPTPWTHAHRHPV